MALHVGNPGSVSSGLDHIAAMSAGRLKRSSTYLYRRRCLASSPEKKGDERGSTVGLGKLGDATVGAEMALFSTLASYGSHVMRWIAVGPVR